MDIYAEDWLTAKHSTGTTIMAVEFNGGVIIGADSRTATGGYVANRIADKLTQLSGKIYCCRSGSAADTQAIADVVRYSLNYHENQTSQEPLVAEAASEVRNYCYNYRESLLAGIIVAGWDKKYGGQVFQIPLGGMLHRSKYAIGGSGSSYIHGFIREFYKDNMTQEDCLEFVKKSVFHAMSCDGSSGGVCRIGIITKDGIIRQTYYAKAEPISGAAPAVPSVSGVRA